MDIGYNPVQFGNNSTISTSDVLKQVHSNKSSSTGGKGLSELYKKYFGDTKTTNSNNSPKIDANTGNSLYNGLANLGQFLGIGRNVQSQAPTVNEYLTYDRDTDLANLRMRYDQAIADGASTKDWNWNDMVSNYDKLYSQNIQNTINSIPDDGTVLPYGTHQWSAGGN